MSHQKKHYPSLAAASRESGVTRTTLKRWRDVEGVEVLDPQALAARQGLKQLRVASQAVDPGTSTAPESYAEARRRRAVADADRAEIAAAKEAGDTIDYATAERAARVIFIVFRGCLRDLEGTLPTMLEGLPPQKMFVALRRAFDEALDKIGALELMTNHPEVIAYRQRMEALDRKTLCRRCRKKLENDK
jgi:hypothetical protein